MSFHHPLLSVPPPACPSSPHHSSTLWPHTHTYFTAPLAQPITQGAEQEGSPSSMPFSPPPTSPCPGSSCPGLQMSASQGMLVPSPTYPARWSVGTTSVHYLWLWAGQLFHLQESSSTFFVVQNAHPVGWKTSVKNTFKIIPWVKE